MLTVLLLVASELDAQDFHLTQYESTPQYFNPALTGVYFDKDNTLRINTNYRSQWKSITSKAYSTFSLGCDYAINERWGVGGFVINNRSGIEHFNTLTTMFSGSYRIINDPSNKHNLSVGIQMGMFSKSFDPTDLLFEQQFSSSSGFDSNSPSGETFERNNIIRYDANFGMYYKYIGDDWFKWQTGLAAHHLTMPNESFSGIEQKLPVRISYFLEFDFVLGSGFEVAVSGMSMQQAMAFESTGKMLLSYNIGDTDIKAIGGAGFRAKDALLLYLGMEKDDYAVRFSYDANTSYLSSYSGGMGAWEFSVIYYGGSK